MGQNNKNNTDGQTNLTTTAAAAITVVLKVDLHCDGCVSKITRNLRAFQGVETVKVESHTGKITLTGILDPLKVRDKLVDKTKKKVQLLSPQPKKEKENEEKQKDKDNKPKEKEKEAPVITVVLRVLLHCQGCIHRITKIVSKTKGVHNMSIDEEKGTISVKGTMDVKALAGDLMNKLKRKVEVVPPKKEKDNDKEGGDKEGGGGGKKKNKGGGGGGDGGEMDQGKMEYLAHPAVGFAYPYPENYHLHAPQMFSDENPNACSVM